MAETSVAGLNVPATPRRHERLANELVQSIADQIISGSLPPETPLPSEAAMSESFGVSRTVVRESIKLLENVGLVQIHQGKKSWTAAPESWDLLDPVVLESRIRHDLDASFMDDLIAVRAALEAEMAGQAAQRMSDDELDQIVACFEDLERVVHSPSDYNRAERAFHAQIMRASRNALGRVIVSAIADKARASRQYVGEETPVALMEHTHIGHGKVLKYLIDRDSTHAALAMSEHIRTSWAWRHTAAGLHHQHASQIPEARGTTP